MIKYTTMKENKGPHALECIRVCCLGNTHGQPLRHQHFLKEVAMAAMVVMATRIVMGAGMHVFFIKCARGIDFYSVRCDNCECLKIYIWSKISDHAFVFM